MGIRLSVLKNLTDISNAKILEIGALDSPTVKKDQCRNKIKFLDFASKEDLHENSKSNPRYALDRLVDVDYVVPSLDYSSSVKEKFDLIIANHVVEHIPNLIKWFVEIDRILLPGGKVFLSVPDKRFTFDIVRETTKIENLILAYREGYSKPNFMHIFQHFYYHKNVNAEEIWNNNHESKLKIKRFELSEALEVANKLSKLDYADVHCNVFTRDSFFKLFNEATELNLFDLKIDFINDVMFGSNEFHIMLKKGDA